MVLVAVSAVACSPESEPVPATMPPRDPAGATVRTIGVGPDSIEAHSFVRRGDVSESDRLLVGLWEGIEARAFIQFDPDSFAVTSDGDTLAGAVVLDATLSLNCSPGQGGSELAVRLAGVAAGATEAWYEDSLSWPGPALLAESAGAILANCETGDDFPEREIDVPPALIETWIADAANNNGLALSVDATSMPLRVRGGGALLQIASSENNFAFLDSVGTITTPPGPRLRFRAHLGGGAGDTVSVFFGSGTVTADAYAVSPDAAELPCADPGDCVQIGRGASHRAVFRFLLPSLPRGANVHRAVLSLSALGHPRFDGALELDVFRLTSTWPGAAAADSLVETDGVLWHEATLDSAAAGVDVPVTELVQAWYDRAFPNEGLLVRASDEDDGVRTESVAASDHPSEGLRPRLEIAYSTPFGGRP